MGLEVVEVVLQPHQPVYFPGQTVRGFVRVVATKAIYCQEISVTHRGKGKVYWEERRGKITVRFLATEDYFRRKDILWKGIDTNNKLGPGEFKLAFSCPLPFSLTTSMECRHGGFRYTVMATVVRRFGKKKRTEMCYSVHQTFGQLHIDSVKGPLHEAKKQLVVGVEGPVWLEVSAKKRGYVVGETMEVDAAINNPTDTNIKYTELKIVQLTDYAVDKNFMRERRTVQRVYLHGVKAGKQERWSDVPVLIPPLPPSHVEFSTIMDIAYALELHVKFGFGRSAQVLALIHILKVPCRRALVAETENVNEERENGNEETENKLEEAEEEYWFKEKRHGKKENSSGETENREGEKENRYRDKAKGNGETENRHDETEGRQEEKENEHGLKGEGKRTTEDENGATEDGNGTAENGTSVVPAQPPASGPLFPFPVEFLPEGYKHLSHPFYGSCTIPANKDAPHQSSSSSSPPAPPPGSPHPPKSRSPKKFFRRRYSPNYLAFPLTPSC